LCFAVKLPLFPFHVWLPEAHVEAPTPGSMFLAGILLKMGGYAIYRFLVPLFEHFLVFSTVTCTFFKVCCLLSIFYGRLGALAQTDIKKVVAYSSVSHMGFCTLGFLPSESPLLSNTGAFGLMVSHGLTSRALFFLVGELYFRYGTRNIAAFSGIGSLHPVFSSHVIFFSFANIGFPGTPGYPPEVFILSSLSTFFHLTWAAAVGSFLGAFYTLFSFVRILWGPLSVPSLSPLYSSYTAERDDLSILDSLSLFLFLIVPSLILSFFPRVLYEPFEYFF
jgi:NADH-quinone oxidoreductase subunit M